MFIRLGQWLDAVFLKVRTSWAWIGAIGGSLAMLFSAWPNLRPEWLTATVVALSGIVSFLLVLGGSFSVWKQERDHVERLLDRAHLIFVGGFITTDNDVFEASFTFSNAGEIALNGISVFIRLLWNGYSIAQAQSQLEHLEPKDFHTVKVFVDRNTTVPFQVALEKNITVNFELNSFYTQGTSNRRFRGGRVVLRLHRHSRTFEKTAQNPVEQSPLPPSKWAKLVQAFAGRIMIFDSNIII
jgi:hypothetical protein